MRLSSQFPPWAAMTSATSSTSPGLSGPSSVRTRSAMRASIAPRWQALQSPSVTSLLEGHLDRHLLALAEHHRRRRLARLAAAQRVHEVLDGADLVRAHLDQDVATPPPGSLGRTTQAPARQRHA